MKTICPRDLRRHWIDGSEVALLDVREEGQYAESHPLFAVSVPVSEIEEKLPALVPRLSAPIVLYDDGEGYIERAFNRVAALGYTEVAVLEGGLKGYARVGEVYQDVNVPSKAFGELVESIRHTPSLSARDVKGILDSQDDVVVVDARRYEEFNTMSIPRGRSCPGGELVYRIHDAAPSPETHVIVNCAGRTRSIIGTQSLINAEMVPIGWTLEGLEVERKKTERVPTPLVEAQAHARTNAERWAEHVGVPFVSADTVSKFLEEADARTLYMLDVRDPEEYLADHPAGFISAPGGQLVQAIDEWVGVRGARIVLYDNDGVRARMTGSWLIQMGWDVHVLEDDTEVPSSIPPAATSNKPQEAAITVSELQKMEDVSIIDLARSPMYRKGHIPGSYFASGPELARDLNVLPGSGPIVLTSANGIIAAANVSYAQKSTSRPVRYLSGGTDDWVRAGGALDTTCKWLSKPIDVYKRPYEGTDNARVNMQSYIDWELQLVAQLANDGVSGFHVVRAAS